MVTQRGREEEEKGRERQRGMEGGVERQRQRGREGEREEDRQTDRQMRGWVGEDQCPLRNPKFSVHTNRKDKNRSSPAFSQLRRVYHVIGP